jgi:hypothetical protein
MYEVVWATVGDRWVTLNKSDSNVLLMTASAPGTFAGSQCDLFSMYMRLPNPTCMEKKTLAARAIPKTTVFGGARSLLRENVRVVQSTQCGISLPTRSM